MASSLINSQHLLAQPENVNTWLLSLIWAKRSHYVMKHHKKFYYDFCLTSLMLFLLSIFVCLINSILLCSTLKCKHTASFINLDQNKLSCLQNETLQKNCIIIFITSFSKEVMFSVTFVCLFVCKQYYSKDFE